MEVTETKIDAWIRRLETAEDVKKDPDKDTANMAESDYRILLMEMEHR